jgi:polyisoprenyl-phosphate glycosyltransferase
MSEPTISIIIPVYKGELLTDELVRRISKNTSIITSSFEIVLVDDFSPDNSWAVIQEICNSNTKVKGIKLSRNFGQHYAITAGLQHAKGDWIVVMDCDLQDRPEEIPSLYNKTQEGYDIVYARREIRQDNLMKKISSKLFYTVFGYLTNTKHDASIANFGIYHKKVIHAILSMKDHIRYFPTMVQWVGFSSSYINIEHRKREIGESSYSWKSLLNLAFNNIIAFSDKPLRLCIRIGIIISLVAFLCGIYFLFKYFTGQIVVLGFTSMIISIWFLSGIIILILGIIGVYLGKTFERVKDRPTYIINEKRNFE